MGASLKAVLELLELELVVGPSGSPSPCFGMPFGPAGSGPFAVGWEEADVVESVTGIMVIAVAFSVVVVPGVGSSGLSNV